jgi:hypothetical protein
MSRAGRPPIRLKTTWLLARWAWVALALVIWAFAAGFACDAEVRRQPSDSPHPAAQGSEPPDPASGADASAGAEGVRTVRCQRGMVIRAEGGAFRNIVGTMPVPGNWPGQQRVRVVKEELPPGAVVKYQTLPDSTRQMTVRLPSLAAGAEARAVVTFEVELMPAPPVPADALQFSAPVPAKLDRETVKYLAPSPLIDSDHPTVRQLAREVAGSRETGWDKARAIHAWVYANIQFVLPPELGRQSVLETIEKRTGVCAEKNSLAVALLRAAGVPARLIGVTSSTDVQHCYYELYLVDGQGQGVWFAGDASTSATLDPEIGKGRVILQKGDSVMAMDPKTGKKTKQRFLPVTLSGLPRVPGTRLQLQLIAQ